MLPYLARSWTLDLTQYIGRLPNAEIGTLEKEDSYQRF